MTDKQIFCPENAPLQSFASQYPVLSGTFSPTGSFNELYSTLLPQSSAERLQTKPLEPPYTFPDLPSWDTTLKGAEKIDTLDVSVKDSTSGYHMDSIAPQESLYSSQWLNASNNMTYGVKAGSYSSCAQISKSYEEFSKPTTYCSIQTSSMDRDGYRSCAFYNTNVCYNQGKELGGTQDVYSYSTCYNSAKYLGNEHFNSSASYMSQKLNPSDIKDPFDISFSDLSALDHQTEASNDESDIVVEDSSSEGSEEQEQRLLYNTTSCFVCNTQYTPLGLQFYVLTAANPLTMSSQIPVKRKIAEFIRNTNIFSKKNFLCNDCLGLVNSIDHLQLKLDGLIKSLLIKLKSSCPKKRAQFKKYKCKKCSKVLCVKTCLNNHIKRHKFRGYLCELCGKTVRTYKKLRHHIKSHNTSSVPQIPAFECSNEHCDKHFRTKFHLTEHENFCLGLLPFKCKHCSKKFASATKLKNHMKLKHEKKFIAICSICNIGFVKASDYKSHMTSHSTDKKFPCTKCDKSYKTLSNLNFHLKSHDTTLPYICTVCHKGFMRKEYHEAHMNNHKGVKNFACPVCQKKFVSQKNLDAHVKYHDGSVKNSPCTICKKVITSCFAEHMRVHSNFKEFDCNLCDLKFNTKNSLRKHRKRKHEGPSHQEV